jgi:hypothetical protein
MTIWIRVLSDSVPADLSPDDEVYVHEPDARLDRKFRIQSIAIASGREGEAVELEFGLPEEGLEAVLLGVWRDAKRLGLIPGDAEARRVEL